MGPTAVFQEVTGGFLGSVEELPAANMRGRTLEEVPENLHETVAPAFEANRELAAEPLTVDTTIRESRTQAE